MIIGVALNSMHVYMCTCGAKDWWSVVEVVVKQDSPRE